MNWLLQDLFVTSIAVAAVTVLMRRVTGAIAPRRDHAGCTTCPSCPAPKPAAPQERLIQIATREQARPGRQDVVMPDIRSTAPQTDHS
jgi:hypothetical protein